MFVLNVSQRKLVASTVYSGLAQTFHFFNYHHNSSSHLIFKRVFFFFFTEKHAAYIANVIRESCIFNLEPSSSIAQSYFDTWHIWSNCLKTKNISPCFGRFVWAYVKRQLHSDADTTSKARPPRKGGRGSQLSLPVVTIQKQKVNYRIQNKTWQSCIPVTVGCCETNADLFSPGLHADATC